MSGVSSRGSDKPRKVKLLCPSLSKIVALVAWEEQRLDLGSIARVFGLDPSTLKVNGHFISRGVDLVSSSVTWRSLLNFFSAKGLSTGKDDEDALIVDGKLSKVGIKRKAENPSFSLSSGAHDPQEAASRNQYQPESEFFNLITNKKLKEYNSGGEEGKHVPPLNGFGFKRKELLEDVSPVKKLKINEADSDLGGRGNKHLSNGILSSRQFKCSHGGGDLKRMREEVILAAPCKKG